MSDIITHDLMEIVNNRERATSLTQEDKDRMIQTLSSLSNDQFEFVLGSFSFQQKLSICGILDSPNLLMKIPVTNINEYSELSSFISFHIFQTNYQTQFLISSMLLNQKYLINYIQNGIDLSAAYGHQQQLDTKVNTIEQRIQALEQRIEEQLQTSQLQQRSVTALRNDVNQFKRIQEPLELFVERITIPNGSDLGKILDLPVAFHYCSRDTFRTLKNRPPIQPTHGILFENSFVGESDAKWLTFKDGERRMYLQEKIHLLGPNEYSWSTNKY